MRFPHVGESVCKFLDDESLMELKEVSRISKSSIENQRHSWVRIIHESNCADLDDGFPESWISILTKSPIEIVKQIGIEFAQLEECVDIEAFQLPGSFSPSIIFLTYFSQLFVDFSTYLSEIYIQSAPNNSNATHTFMCLGRAGRYGQSRPFWAALKLL